MRINPNQMPDEQMLLSVDQLAVFLGGSGHSFTGDLLRLIARADAVNLLRLQRGFAAEVLAYQTWMSLSNPTVVRLTDALEALLSATP